MFLQLVNVVTESVNAVAIFVDKFQVVFSLCTSFFAYKTWKVVVEINRKKNYPDLNLTTNGTQDRSMLHLRLELRGEKPASGIRLTSHNGKQHTLHAADLKEGQHADFNLQNDKNGTPIIIEFEDRIGTKYQMKTKILNDALDTPVKISRRGLPILRNLF
jgi:hypothetical protein